MKKHYKLLLLEAAFAILNRLMTIWLFWYLVSAQQHPDVGKETKGDRRRKAMREFIKSRTISEQHKGSNTDSMKVEQVMISVVTLRLTV